MKFEPKNFRNLKTLIYNTANVDNFIQVDRIECYYSLLHHCRLLCRYAMFQKLILSRAQAVVWEGKALRSDATDACTVRLRFYSTV